MPIAARRGWCMRCRLAGCDRTASPQRHGDTEATPRESPCLRVSVAAPLQLPASPPQLHDARFTRTHHPQRGLRLLIQPE